MTYGPIAFEPDVYGTYARASAAADYLELLALNGAQSVKQAQVTDWIDDNEWHSLFSQQFDDVGTRRSVSTPEEAASTVFTLLTQRADALAEAYPFNISTSALSARPRTEEHDGYLYLLGLTTAHGYKLPVGSSLPELFEFSLERVMILRMGLATAFRRHLGAGGFHPAVQRAVDTIGLRCVPPGAPVVVSTSADDEGLDVLAHASWGDGRRGRWVFIGQATVAKSDQWKKKIGDASISEWRSLLEEGLPPVGFLAVPHHIQPGHWDWLLHNDRALVDRLRLAPWLAPVDQQEGPLAALTRDIAIDPIVV